MLERLSGQLAKGMVSDSTRQTGGSSAKVGRDRYREKRRRNSFSYILSCLEQHHLQASPAVSGEDGGRGKRCEFSAVS